MIKLYNGDCLEVMKEIQSKSIDMILCDLPYQVTKMKYVPTGEMRLYLSEYHLLDKEEIDKLNEEEKEYREGLLYED